MWNIDERHIITNSFVVYLLQTGVNTVNMLSIVSSSVHSLKFATPVLPYTVHMSVMAVGQNCTWPAPFVQLSCLPGYCVCWALPG